MPKKNGGAPNCLACLNVSRKRPIAPGPIIHSGKFWIVDHAYPVTVPGWLVVVLKRHAEAPHELMPQEFTELSEILHRSSLLLARIVKCSKEYVACFSESPQFRHVHFHVIPRAGNMEEPAGPRIFERMTEPDAPTRRRIVALSGKLKDLFPFR
jgi:diadenosine tetraphosphate (Ap4A) HIT family hydrolase